MGCERGHLDADRAYRSAMPFVSRYRFYFRGEHPVLFLGLAHLSGGGLVPVRLQSLRDDPQTHLHPLPHTFARRLATLIESGSSRDTNSTTNTRRADSGGYGCVQRSNDRRAGMQFACGLECRSGAVRTPAGPTLRIRSRCNIPFYLLDEIMHTRISTLFYPRTYFSGIVWIIYPS